MVEIKALEWESEFFRKKIFLLEDLKEDIGNLDYDLVQSNVDLSEKDGIRSLEDKGFHLEELNITFRKKISKTNIEFPYLKAGSKDLEKLLFLAGNLKKSRFNIHGRDEVKRFYQEWIKNSINSKLDDICFFLEESDSIAGLITVKKLDEKVSRIGLIIVDENFQGKGVGKRLLRLAENYTLEQGLEEILVSTQGTNIRAQKFYNKNGYYLDDIKAWYYLVKEG